MYASQKRANPFAQQGTPQHGGLQHSGQHLEEAGLQKSEPGLQKGVARVPGIDLARGVAVLLMIETHATDAWTRAGAKATYAYHITRVLASIPSSLFLLLAGIGLALGSQAQLLRGTPADAVRAQLLRRGLGIVGYGYLVSALYLLIEGYFALHDMMRADILHCIGLSLMLCSWLLIARSHQVLRTLLIAAVSLLCGVLFPRLVHPDSLPRVLAIPVALFVDVRPYSRFPLCPLVSYTAVGFLIGQLLMSFRPTSRLALLLAAGCAALAVALTGAIDVAMSLLGGVLTRSHPAVVLNVLNGCARSLAVLFLCLALFKFLPQRTPKDGPSRPPWPSWIVRLGQGSLLAYAFHVPFCYGRLLKPLRHRLTLGGALLATCGLALLTYLVVRLRDALRDARRAPKSHGLAVR